MKPIGRPWRTLLSLLTVLCMVCAATACAPRRTAYQSQTYLMMDTVIEIKLDCDADTARAAFAQCRDILTQTEQLLSRTVEQSAVSRFNRTGEVSWDETHAAWLLRMLDICAQTDGAFDPTVAPLTALWETCGEAQRLPQADELAACLASVGYEKLSLSADGTLTRTHPQTMLDLGAIGKGYAIDRLLAYLNSTDIAGGLISFGGNVAVFGQKQSGEPYRIGVRDPSRTSEVLGYVQLDAGVISVSGDYERYVTIGGERYHHILDPATGYPTDNGLHSVAVICEDASLADALSTALFVMGAERAMAFYREQVYAFEAILVTDTHILLTDGLAAQGSFEQSGADRTLSPAP